MNINSSSSRPSPANPPDDENKPRKRLMIVLCFDGTGNEYGTANTNVVKLFSLLRKDKDHVQVCYYQAGIGTYFAPGFVRPFYRSVAELADQAFAWYLSEHVIGGYKFLMQNYDYGDKVCIFGFSRGAYTARALAGMLHKVGLLAKDNMEQVPFAYRLYKSRGSKNESLARGFKATFCRAVPIHFVGVWDTVSSVGLVMAPSLPFVEVNTTIRVFRQALSLDERRAKFRPNYRFPGKSPEPSDQHGIQQWSDELFEADVKEVWFAGCHSDVGGGASPDTERQSLSNISLRWMIKEILLADCGILFDNEAFDQWHIPRIPGLNSVSRSGGEGAPASEEGPGLSVEAEDAQDALQNITDELNKKPWWWILEIFPTSYTYWNASKEWVTTWLPHFGRGRKVPEGALFHTSVKTRIDKLNYKPRARYDPATVTYES